MNQIKLYILDDHLIIRETLEDFLKTKPSCSIVGSGATGKAFINFLSTGHEVDVVLMDLKMPEMNGYEVAELLKKDWPEVKIVVLTMYDNEHTTLELLRLGVRAVLTKNTCRNELWNAIQAVASDGYYYQSSVASNIRSFFKNQTRNAAYESVLSEKELRFLQLMVTDLSYKQVADKLNVSVRTVETYKEHLCTRFDVRSRVGLAMYVISNGIVVV